jgi:5-formyltetrahydrofolate cyclo-ligase
MRKVRAQIPTDVAARAALDATDFVLGLPEVAAAKMVGLYASIRDELDSGPLARALVARGIALAYPRVIPGRRRLAFHRVDDPGALVLSDLGIPEPGPDAPAVAIEHIDVFVVPGLAFDRSGQRLGWGAGHYDTTLSDSHATRVGFAFECQLVAAVPSGDLDQPMSYIVTEAGVIDCRADRQP